MFFITSILITLLFFLVICFPILSWLLPYYKIKKLENISLSERILIEIGTILLIGFIDYHSLFLYVGVLGIIDILYVLLKKYRIGEFNKIFSITFISGSILNLFLYFNKKDFFNVIYTVLSNMKENSAYSELTQIYGYMINNFISISYIYLGLMIFVLYYILDRKRFFTWKLSYLWLIPYIILFFMDRFYYPNNSLILNFLKTFKFIYIIYFLQNLAIQINRFIKQQNLSVLASGFVTLISPKISFIFGAIISLLKRD